MCNYFGTEGVLGPFASLPPLPIGPHGIMCHLVLARACALGRCTPILVPSVFVQLLPYNYNTQPAGRCFQRPLPPTGCRRPVCAPGQGWIRMAEHPNYPCSYPLKTSIWISVFVFDFNMNVIWMHLNLTLRTFLYLIPYSYSRNIRSHPYPSVSAKKK